LNARRFYKDGENILLVIEDITDCQVPNYSDKRSKASFLT
jgi:hypothetical protein